MSRASCITRRHRWNELAREPPCRRTTNCLDAEARGGLYRQAYKKGNATAAYNLAALHLRHGRHRLAVEWFERAYRAEDPSALLELGCAELYGLGMPRDAAAGVAKLEKMANSSTKFWPPSTGDNVEAMLLLADAFMTGWLVPRDYDKASAWLRRAASWDNPIAKAILVER